MNIPNGAEVVISARKRGMKPAELLIVSLIGKVNESNHTIYANDKGEYDWRWAIGLDVCLYVNNETNWQKQMRAIGACKPNWFGVYNVDQFKGARAYYLPHPSDIDKPSSQWRHVLDFLPWTDRQNEEFSFED